MVDILFAVATEYFTLCHETKIIRKKTHNKHIYNWILVILGYSKKNTTIYEYTYP